MIRRLLLAAAALALLSGAPVLAQDRGATQEYSLLNADRSYRLGLQQYRLQRYDEAVRHFEKAVSLAPSVDTYRNALQASRLRQAQQQATQRTNKESADRLRQVFGADDDDTPSAQPGGGQILA